MPQPATDLTPAEHALLRQAMQTVREQAQLMQAPTLDALIALNMKIQLADTIILSYR